MSPAYARHPQSQHNLLRNAMNRGLGAAAIGAAGLAAHYGRLPAGGASKRARTDSLDTPNELEDWAHIPSQDSQVPQSQGLPSLGSLNSLNQFASGAGGDGATPGGGANQGGGPVPNTQSSPNEGGNTFTYRHHGTFHISDGGQHNTWTPVPWEFPRLWIQNEEIKEAWKNYRWYRTKSVKITFKNPYQRYRFTQATGNINTHSDPNARLLVACDDDNLYGVPFYTDWNEDDWNAFRRATQYGGFDRHSNSAYVLPRAMDMDAIDANNELMRYPVADFSNGVQEIQVGLGQSYTKTYSPTEKSWRSIEELVHSPGIQFNNNTVRQQLISPQQELGIISGLTTATTTFLIPWRADNYGCWRYNTAATGPTGHQNEDQSPVWSMYRHDYASGFSNIMSTTDYPKYYSKWYYPIPALIDQGTIEGGGNPSYTRRLLANPCEEENPQPMMWLSYRNMITNDGTSAMDQKIMLDFEYEWVIEVGGKINTKNNSMVNMVHNDGMPTQYNEETIAPSQTFKRHPTLLGTTKWLAYPEYPVWSMMGGSDRVVTNNWEAHMPGGARCFRSHANILKVFAQPYVDPSKECE